MNYKTHLAGGILAGVSTVMPVSEVLQTGMNPIGTVGAIYIVSSIAGSLFPDLDHKGSYLSKRMKITSMVMSNMFSHRGVTHSPILLSLGTFAFYFLSMLLCPGDINGIIAGGFLAGAISHVLLDWLTKGGVPILLPFTKSKYSLLKMKSGRFGEKMVFILCIGLTSYLLMTQFDINILQ